MSSVLRLRNPGLESCFKYKYKEKLLRQTEFYILDRDPFQR